MTGGTGTDFVDISDDCSPETLQEPSSRDLVIRVLAPGACIVG